MKCLAQKYNLKYFETSAKTNMNVKEGFDYIVNNTYDKIQESNKYVIDLNDKNEEKQECVGKKKKIKNKNKK